MCLRRRPVSAGHKDVSAGWHFGVGRYRGDELAWYRLTSLRPGPSTVLDRLELEIVGRRTPAEAEVYAIPQADSVLSCRSRGADLEIAMAPGVLTGFLSWLESAPPGAHDGLPAGLLEQPAQSAAAAEGPPGCHSTSPAGLATRPRMNSRSDSRLR